MPKARPQCPFHVLALYSCLCHFLGPPNNPKTQLPALFQQQAHPAVRYTTRSSTYYLSSPSSLSAFWNQPKSLASICNSSSFQGLLGPFSLLESAKPSAAIYNSSSFQGLLGQTFLFLISSPLGLLESSYFLTLWDYWNLLISSPFETFGIFLFPHPLRLLKSPCFLALWDCLCLWSFGHNLLWPKFLSSFGFLQSHFDLVLLLERSRKYNASDFCPWLCALFNLASHWLKPCKH